MSDENDIERIVKRAYKVGSYHTDDGSNELTEALFRAELQAYGDAREAKGREEAHENWLNDLNEMGMIVGVREGDAFKEYERQEVLQALTPPPQPDKPEGV